MLSLRRAVSAKRDYYDVLGIARDCGEAEIKRAYRKCAMQFHPDRNPGDTAAEERFKEAAEAFEVLSDPEKRQLYDRFGHEGPSRMGFTGFSGAEEIFAHFGDLFGDLFDNLGFGSRRSRGPRRGPDIKVALELDLVDVLERKEHEVVVPRRVRCETCTGSGAAPGTQPETCRQCGGAGQVIHRQGFFTLQTTCPVCRGDGRMIVKPCEDCGGTGVVQRQVTLSVGVPAGVPDGQILRVPERGQPGPNGGPAGDLYVVISLRPNEDFERDGFDVHSEIEVSMLQATLGCSVKIPTLWGDAELEVPAGSQPEHVFVRKGEGIPILGGRGRGDHHVHLTVVVPRKLSSEHADVLRKLAEELGEEVAPPRKGLLSGFRRRKRD